MSSSVYIRIGMILASMLALAGLVCARYGKAILWCHLLWGGACALGAMAIAAVGVTTSARPFSSPLMAIAGTGVALGTSSLFAPGAPRRVTIAIGVVMAVALGIGAASAGSGRSSALSGGPLLDASEAVYVLAGGILLLGAIVSSGSRGGAEQSAATVALSLALMLQTASLVALGAGAQRAWGSYWSWDPGECWRLTTWLVTAMAALGFWRLGWRKRKATVVLWLASLWTLAVLLGALPLVRWLGLSSLVLAW